MLCCCNLQQGDQLAVQLVRVGVANLCLTLWAKSSWLYRPNMIGPQKVARNGDKLVCHAWRHAPASRSPRSCEERLMERASCRRTAGASILENLRRTHLLPTGLELERLLHRSFRAWQLLDYQAPRLGRGGLGARGLSGGGRGGFGRGMCPGLLRVCALQMFRSTRIRSD